MPGVGERVHVGADVRRQLDRVLGELKAARSLGAGGVVAAVAGHEPRHPRPVAGHRRVGPERHAEVDDLVRCAPARSPAAPARRRSAPACRARRRRPRSSGHERQRDDRRGVRRRDRDRRHHEQERTAQDLGQPRPEVLDDQDVATRAVRCAPGRGTASGAGGRACPGWGRRSRRGSPRGRRGSAPPRARGTGGRSRPRRCSARRSRTRAGRRRPPGCPGRRPRAPRPSARAPARAARRPPPPGRRTAAARYSSMLLPCGNMCRAASRCVPAWATVENHVAEIRPPGIEWAMSATSSTENVARSVPRHPAMSSETGWERSTTSNADGSSSGSRPDAGTGGRQIERPPSTGRVMPVMKLLSSEAK